MRSDSSPTDFVPPVRYKDERLQAQFEGSLLNPPGAARAGRAARRKASGWYEAFWRGYDGVDNPAAKGAPGTLRRAVWAAGRERRRLEKAGRLPTCDPEA